jgi:protein gp37
MGDKSKIDWTDATWNPIVGCSIVSPACTNCYAMEMAGRLSAMAEAHKAAHGGDPGPLCHYDGLIQPSRGGAVWTGKTALAPDAVLTKPLHWRRPRRIFVNSMGDLFHESVPDEWIDRVFAVMALAPQHTFQVLTKRAKRMRGYFEGRRANFGRCSDALSDIETSQDEDEIQFAADWLDNFDAGGRPLQNVWLGVTAEDQERADERIHDLLETPAAKRFVSIEPMLGPVDLTFLRQENMGCGPWWVDALDIERAGWFHDEAATDPMEDSQARYDLGVLDWVIAGGESGARARASHPGWFRYLRDQCAAAGVAFFFKQMAGKAKAERDAIPEDLQIREFPDAR